MSVAYQYRVGGHLPIDAPSYVVRAADREFYEGLKAGNLCYVLNSRQMGKSSLRFRTMHRLQQEGMACVAIDLQGIGSRNITPQQWYAGLVKRLVQGLHLTTQFDLRTWWQERDVLSPVQRWSEFLEVVLPQLIDRPVTIFIDEIDSTLSLEFDTDDFFAAVRVCSGFPKINFALLGVATPADLIQDRRHSPFNIGQAIDLRGFQSSEVQPLIQGLTDKAVRPEVVLAAILDWTGGQPFLTQKLCKLIQDLDTPLPSHYETEFVETLVRSRVITNWESQDEPEHLKTIRNYLVRSGQPQTGQALQLYQKILGQGFAAADDSLAQVELRLSGLVIKKNDRLEIGNQIYAQVFDQSWLDRVLGAYPPYGAALAAWLASDRQDAAQLLQGAALQAAQTWAKGKTLGSEERDFLQASHQQAQAVRQKQRFRQTAIGGALVLGVSTTMLAVHFFSPSPQSQSQSPQATEVAAPTQSPLAVQTPATHRQQVRNLLGSSVLLRGNQQNYQSLLAGVKAAQQLSQVQGKKPRLQMLVQKNLRQGLRNLGRSVPLQGNGNTDQNTNLDSLVQQSCQALREYLKTAPDLSVQDRQSCDGY